jgi:hypothetical protein
VSIDHTVVPVAGADELLTDVVDAAAGGSQVARAAARLSARAAGLDLHEAAARSAVEGRCVVLARHPSGAALAAKWFAPGVATSIHENNGWGVALVVAGTDRYEEWALAEDGTVTLVEARQLGAGDCAWWGEPPHDIHRQEALGDGAVELIVVGAEPRRPLTEYQPTGNTDDQRAAHP